MRLRNRLRFPPRFALPPILALALAALGGPALAAAGHPLPLWRVTDGHGHVMYLAGSMHALTTKDYPLPADFTGAFKRSRRLVEELDLNTISPQMLLAAVHSYARLPAGKTLAAAMGTGWSRAQALAKKADINLELYQNYKPWFAAVRIGARRFVAAGYQPALGLDRHFANLAAERKMPVVGLETLDEQMGFLNAIEPVLQRRFLLQTLEQAPQVKSELAALHTAWRNGDTATLADIAKQDFEGYPGLRRELLDARNKRWLPTLERCLSEDRGCFVVVGMEHMIGPVGLLALLEQAGDHVTQLHAAAPAPNPASANAASEGR
ncbi:MAG: TraB/GumN family protein [Gammaproteobacteria bacterium]